MRRSGDWFLIGLVVAMVVMVVLPMPTWLLDILLLCNFAFSLALLLLAVRTSDPRRLVSFPRLLLLSTLLRVGLNVAATRLILLQADAGRIIDAFGQFVVGGSLVVGLVVFAVLTIVQYVVISRGAERVAEVAARFMLDAIPGKQLAIDAELRAGSLQPEAARDRRNALDRDAHLFGAMDGAMKFVRGDAIATILIVLVNLGGGLAIGILQQGMSPSEAIGIYSVLTIGEGLVAELPALVVSVSAGLLVTRVVQPDKTRADSEVPLVLHLSAGATRPDVARLRGDVSRELGVVVPAIGIVHDFGSGGELRWFGARIAQFGGEVTDAALRDALASHASEWVGIQEARELLAELEVTHPVLVREVVPKVISLAVFTDVLRRLLAEGIPISPLREIVEALARVGGDTQDAAALTEQVRRTLRRRITHRYANGKGLDAYRLDPLLEDVLRGPDLEPEAAEDLLRAVNRIVGKRPGGVIVTSGELRGQLRRIVERERPDIAVLAYQELLPNLPIRTVGQIEIGES